MASALKFEGSGTTPLPNHVDSLSSPSESMSVSPPHFALQSLSSVDSLDSMSCLSAVSYSHSTRSTSSSCASDEQSLSSPLLRDLELATLSLTDTEHEMGVTPTPPMALAASSKFAFCSDSLPPLRRPTDCPFDDDCADEVSLSYALALDLDLGGDPRCGTKAVRSEEDNPFLLGLAIDIPEADDDVFPEIESCGDDDEDSDCDPASPDMDCEIDPERRFTMKKYEYCSNIGIGAFGIVDKVRHRRRRHFVALKQSRCIGEAVARQFGTELRILRELRACPFVIDVVDYGRNVDANQMVLCLEWMDIGSLCNVRSFTVAQIAYIGRCALSALEALHRALFVHNDVKPDNILISSEGAVKLIDFGCAMKMEAHSVPLTKVVGSIRYHSFEKRFGSPVRYTTTSDIYSLGLTLADCVSGDHRRCRHSRTLYEHYFVTTPPVGSAPKTDNPHFAPFLALCLEQDAQKRWGAEQLLGHQFIASAPTQMTFARDAE